eukprot:CAMPEP_0201168190 /NCGR_PEP_ID=MMETSP0851-20130426/74514_1 /ASSEMBLY_ACC=CAM_ASM_000631 /TAXON_ID=183588 /ORGANISM="Pseudo-nitzschia fraudulenta, Strain WWA7" /LENGTH=244 /DNA_ID=CAMNT_0047449601 /DNA_START=144 /DNA_END=878 /DNA_ORIENTATION=+
MTILDRAIVDLECRLGLKPDQPLKSDKNNNTNKNNKKQDKKNKGNNNNKNKNNKKQPKGPTPEELAGQPEICKLSFKVGVITKVWDHPHADKLYCEEIDIGEETGARQIASGLRPYFSLDQMLGQRLLVFANLKARNLVKFKSHGMVLCASHKDEASNTDVVEFVEPPEGAKPGDVVTFEGLPAPMPLAASQVEKKKVLVNCLEGLQTDGEGIATWKGHRFVVGEGAGGNNYCRAKTVKNGPMR